MSGNASYHSAENVYSYSLLSQNINIKIHRTVILRTVLYGFEAWSLTLWEKRRLRLFENRVLRKIFGRKRDEVTGSGEDYITRSFMICTRNKILFE